MYILFNCKYEFSLVASQTHDKYSFTSTLCQCAGDKQQRQQQNATTENRLHTIYFFDFFCLFCFLAYFFVLTFWGINSTKWSLEVYAVGVDAAHSYPSYTKSVCRCRFISIPQIKWNFCHISANSAFFLHTFSVVVILVFVDVSLISNHLT